MRPFFSYYGAKYDAQLSFFRDADDAHRTLCKPEDYPPYNLKQETGK